MTELENLKKAKLIFENRKLRDEEEREKNSSFWVKRKKEIQVWLQLI